MADENENAEGKPAEEGEAKGGGSKRIIIIAVFFVVLLGAQIGVAYMIGEKFIRKENKALKAKEEQDKKIAEERKKKTMMGLTLAEPVEVTVNIAGTEGTRYAVVGVQFEWDPEYLQMQELLDARMPKIKDIIINEVSKRPLSELQTSEGKKNITESIRTDVNAILPEPSEDKATGGEVRNTFLDKYLIQ